MEQFEPPFREDHKSHNIIRNVRLLKSQIRTHLVLEEMETTSNEVFDDIEFRIPAGVSILGMSTRETFKGSKSCNVDSGLINCNSRATRKKQVRSVRQCMHV
jgi:hypothetical protein